MDFAPASLCPVPRSGLQCSSENWRSLESLLNWPTNLVLAVLVKCGEVRNTLSLVCIEIVHLKKENAGTKFIKISIFYVFMMHNKLCPSHCHVNKEKIIEEQNYIVTGRPWQVVVVCSKFQQHAVCGSRVDLLRQFHLLPPSVTSYRSNWPSHPVSLLTPGQSVLYGQALGG